MFDESSLKRMLGMMNRHLPEARRSLVELEQEEDPHYVSKDGHRYRIDRDEIVLISSLVDRYEKGRVRLPILIMTDTASESGAWKVEGKIETKVIAAVLEMEPDAEDRIHFYYPHLNDLRRKLPTSTTVMYMP
jgi:uncharacterized protein (UPF0216 family)